jgi:uncharacterized delta-60 repeat protein
MSKLRGAYSVLLLCLLGWLGILVLGKRDSRENAGARDSARSLDRTEVADKTSPAVETGGAVEAIKGFAEWRNRYSKADAAGRKSLLPQGLTLAEARRKQLSGLARTDPSRALDEILSFSELAELPEPILAVCEQPVSAIGSIDLRWLTGSNHESEHSCQHEFRAFAAGKSWRVNGPAFRDAKPPRADVPINGYEINGELLVDPRSVLTLEGANLAAAAKKFPIGNPNGRDPVTGNPATKDSGALIAGKIYHFESDVVVDQVVARLDEADKQATKVKSFKPDHGYTWLEADGGTTGGTNGAPVEATPYLDDNVNVLFIRVDFSDKPGEPVSQANLQSSLTTVNGHIQNYSYGSASITGTVTSQLYRMPFSGATYSANSNGSSLLLSDARNAAAANYTLGNYDVVAVYFPALTGTDFGYAGLASVGGGDHWINGLTTNDSRVSVMVHEFGHNYGLYHSNYWNPAQEIAGTYKGPGSSSLEYGDIFDRMGSADVANGFFGPFSTSRLNWLPQGKITEPASDGTWRIYRFDTATALSNSLVALRVPMGGDEYWWVGHRKLFPAIANSAYVVAEGLYENRPNLIDMTPGSQTPETNDRSDAGLPVGSELYDSESGVRFRTIASGGTSPNEWVDVQIEFDSRIQLAGTAIEVDEKAGSAVLTVSRSFGVSGAVTVNYSTASGTATAGSDFYATSGSVTWADGDGADKQVLVPIRPDSLDDGGESFTFNLTGISGGTLIAAQSSATITLRDAGELLTDFEADFFNTTVKAIAPLDDKSVLIGGSFTSGITGHIARLNESGIHDTSFLKGTGFNGEVRAMLVQSDGKILVGGAFTSYNSTPCNRLVRLNSDGTVDSDFVTAMGTGANATVNALAIETSGKILVGGDFTTFAGGTMEGLVRLTSAGARDTGSALTLPFTSSWETRITALIAQDDGKIMAVGSFYVSPVATGFRSGIARLNTNGTRDESFDPDAGLHVTGSLGSLGTGDTIVRQPDGKYIVGGFFSAYDENAVPNIARVNSNGTFDSSFVPPSFNSSVKSLLLQPSGAVVVGGWFSSPVSGVERLLSNGTVDATFRQGSGPAGSIYSLASASDGALWIGGNFYSYDGTSVWPVVKVAGGVSAYETWLSSYFTDAQILAGLTDASDDPDGDGISNLGEMALGTSPTVANTTTLFAPLAGSAVLASEGPSQYLKATFARSSLNPGVWLAAQFSSNLMSWLPATPLPGTNTVYDVIEDSSTRFTVRDKTAAGTTPRFIRFSVRLPD